MRRCICWAIPFSVLMVGCMDQRRNWFHQSPASNPAKTASATTPTDSSPAGGTTTVPDKQAEETRLRVLSFVDRLENAGQSNEPTDPPSVKQPESGAAQPIEQAAPSQSTSPPTGSAAPADTPNREGSATSSTQAKPGVSDTDAAADGVETEPKLSPPRVLSVSLNARSNQPSTIEPEPDDESQVANRPVNAEKHAPDEPSWDALVQRFTGRIAADSTDVADHWRLALLKQASNPDAAPAETPITIPESSQTLYRESVQTVSAIGRALANPSAGVEDALEAVETLRDELRNRAALTIPVVAMCSSVQAFGMYEELAPGALRPHGSNQAIVYFEVRNFTSERTAEDRYRTLLSDRFEVLTPNGETLWKHEEPTIEDVSRRRRTDFFIAQRIVLPARLGAGPFVLKVTVEDLLADKRTQAIHPFQIGAANTNHRP